MRKLLLFLLVVGLCWPVSAQEVVCSGAVVPSPCMVTAGAVGSAAFPLLAPNSSFAAPSYSFSSASGKGMFNTATGMGFAGGSFYFWYNWSNTNDLQGLSINTQPTSIILSPITLGTGADDIDLVLHTQGSGLGNVILYASNTGAGDAAVVIGQDSLGASNSVYWERNNPGWVFEGASADGNETRLDVVNPTQDQTYKLPNLAAGIYALAASPQTSLVLNHVPLTADYTNATASFTNTALSVSTVSGRKYNFNVSLFFSDSTAADGAQFDFNGGNSTSTNFRAHCTAANNAGAALVLTNAATTALTTAIQTALALTTQSWLHCAGSFEPSSTGTFTMRAAQTAHTTGTLTINRGSYLWVEDIP